MSQILTNIEGILKDKYQPALANLINTEPSPFMEMIRKEPLTNNTVRLAAPVGINGGFGFGSEGAGTPEAGEQRYFDFEVKAVDMYVDVRVSNKTVVLGSSNTSAMINASLPFVEPIGGFPAPPSLHQQFRDCPRDCPVPGE